MKFLNKIYLLLSLVALPIITNLKTETPKTQFSPANTVFAFDLHDVVLKTDYYKAIKTGFQKLPKWPAIKLLVNPWALKEMAKTKKRYGINTKFFENVAKKYPEISCCKDTILELTNYQNINHEMVNIIKQLKQLGYKTYIFSNISTESLDYLKQNQKDLIALFDGIQNPNEENNFTRKPNRLAYILFKKYLRQQDLTNDKNKNIIFVDDKIKNINMGTKYDFTGVKYNNPKQFKLDLNNLGIKF